MRKHKLLLLSAAGLLCYSVHSSAAVIQVLSDLNYANPAELSMIPKGQIILGTGIGNFEQTYNGTSFGAAGRASMNTTSSLSYGRMAWRMSPKVVVALDITQPIIGNINWGANRFLSSSSVFTYANAVNFAPRFSYQLTPQLSFGAGLDLEWKFSTALDFQVPNLGVIRNHSSGFAPGFDFGLFYIYNPTTFVSVSAYSPRWENSTGTSTSSSGLSNRNFSLYYQEPFVLQLHLTKILTEKLLLSGGVYFANWAAQDAFRLKNTVIGDLTFRNNAFNTWSFELGGKYDVTHNVSVLFGSMYETNFAPTQTNSIAYASGGALWFAGGLQAKFLKKFTAQITYAHMFFAPIARFNSAANRGSLTTSLNIVAGRITYDF